MAARYPATLKLAVAHSEVGVDDFELEFPFTVTLMQIKLEIATRLVLATEDIDYLIFSVPSVEYLDQGYPRWVGQTQDLMDGKYSMMKHARRSGWRMEAAGGYDHDVTDEEGWLQAKRWSASKHGAVMSLHVEVPPVVESDEEPGSLGVPEAPTALPLPAAHAPPLEPDPVTPAPAPEKKSKVPLASRLGGVSAARSRGDTAAGDWTPLAKARWGGKNAHLERLQMKAYGSTRVRERAEALRELGEMREKALAMAKVSKQAQLTDEERAAAQASIKEKQRLAELREEERLAKEREAAEAAAAKEREEEEQRLAAASKANEAKSKKAAKEEKKKAKKAAKAAKKLLERELRKQKAEEEAAAQAEGEEKKKQQAREEAKKRVAAAQMDEEYHFAQRFSRDGAVLFIQMVVLVIIAASVVGALTFVYLLLHSCSEPLGEPMAPAIVKHFSPLNLRLLAVQQDTGPVDVRMGSCNLSTSTSANTSSCFSGDEPDCNPAVCCCVRVKVVHRGATLPATKRVQTMMRLQNRVLSIVSTFDRGNTGIFDCPQADITVWIPRDIAVGVLGLTQKVDPQEFYGDGYFDPTPIKTENRMQLQITLNASAAQDWLPPRKSDVRVSLAPDVPFGSASLYSNAGDLEVDGFYGGAVQMLAHGGSISAKNLECESLDLEVRAAHGFTQPDWGTRLLGLLPAVPFLYMWPVMHRTVGTVTVTNVTEWGRSAGSADAATNLASLNAGYQWIERDARWSAEAYREYAGTRAANVYADSTVWNGRFMARDMWLKLDLQKVYTIAGMTLTAFAGGGLPHRCELWVCSDTRSACSGESSTWESVMPFVGDPTDRPQLFEGFEGTGRVFKLTVASTHPALIETGVPASAGAAAVLIYPQLENSPAGWHELGDWKVRSAAARIGLFSDGMSLDVKSGRYSALQSGLYVVATNIQLEIAALASGGCTVAVAVNGNVDARAMRQADSHPDPDFADFSVSGVISMEAGDFVSVWVYAHEDTSYSV
eukprot:COSAG03_NODE_1844_length_3447_cov_2.299283_1_plen_999_part_10